MPRSAARRALTATALLVVPAAGLGARALALKEVEERLALGGVRWSSTDHGLGSGRWLGVERAPARAREIEIALWPPRLVVRGVDVDLAEVQGRAPSGSPRTPAAVPIPIEVEDLAARWGDTLLVQGLSGTLVPLDLRGEGAWLTDRGQGLEGRLPLALSGGPVEASGHVDLKMGEAPEADLRLDHVRVTHAGLSPRPLEGQAQVSAQWDADAKRATATGTVLGIPFTASSEAPTTEAATIEGQVGPVELQHLLALVGAPEASRGRVTGTLCASFRFGWPQRDWRLVPEAEGLGAEGLLPNAEAVRIGTIVWTAQTPEGPRTLTRPPDFVPLEDIAWLGEAVIAMEDSRFRKHRGYDLKNVQEALDAWAAGEVRPRGGSTLTQQLAKNLYLSGDRTVERKLRELALALDLERTARKERLLELYLNVVEFGPGIFGVGPASKAYFSKRPAALLPHEAAFLASLLPSPRSTFDRAAAGRPPKVRMGLVLDAMVFTGDLTAAEAARWKERDLLLSVDR